MRRFWPVLVAFALTAVCLSVFWSYATPHLCYPRYWHPGDSGHGIYNAWQVTIGRVLYRDIFEYRFPLYFFLFGPFLQATGHSLVALQAATILGMAAVAALLAFAFVRAGSDEWIAALGAPVAPLLAFAAWPFPYPPWLEWLFAAGAIAMLAGEKPRFFVAGVLAGLAGLSLQAQGVPLAVGLTVGIFLCSPGRRLAATGRFVAGGLATVLPFVVYFAATGALGDLVWNTITWPTTYYYNGAIRGTGLFAGVREYFEKRGHCQAGPISRLYDASIYGLSALPTAGAVVAAATLIRIALRRQHAELFLGALACAALATYLPNLRPELSDNPHFAFASLASIALLVALAHRAGSYGLVAVVAVSLALVAIHADRAYRFEPFQRRYLDFDDYAARYWKVDRLTSLTEPGDRIVHAPYGGWEYLLSGRESGIPNTWIFADYRFVPPSTWERAAKVMREREPTLLVFKEKAVEQYLFRADPTIPDRYFWNGMGWEKRDLPHGEVAGVWQGGECGKLRLTQESNRLTGWIEKTDVVGSVRGSRVYLVGGPEELLLHLDGGALIGTRNGRSCRFEAPSTDK